MFEPTINTPEVFLNEDFIGVWDNVILDDFNTVSYTHLTLPTILRV